MVLVRIKEASEYLGLHPHTIWKYMDKDIKGVRIGSYRFVDRQELERVAGVPVPE